MVYHSSYTNAAQSSVCSCAVLPVDTIAGFIEEVLDLYRANVLFRNFDVRSDADKLLIYISIFITACLKSTHPAFHPKTVLRQSC
jgi:actin related protein 2/3 complex subunit 3